jgi:hypothetical protein
MTLTPLPVNKRKRRFAPPPKAEPKIESQNGSRS